MVWQDIALMIAGFVFVPALAVSIFKKTKIPYTTSIPTALALTVMVVCFATLGLWLTSVSTSLTALCWYVLALTKYR